MIGLEGESTRTIEKVPANQLSHDSFREAVVETKPLSDDRSAYRGRRAKNDGDHPPLRPVELDANGEGFKPVTWDRPVRHCRAEASSAAHGLWPLRPSTITTGSRGCGKEIWNPPFGLAD